MKTALSIVLFFCLFSLSGSLLVGAEPPQPIKWEYAKLTSNYRDMTKQYYWKTSTEDIRGVDGVELHALLTKDRDPANAAPSTTFDVIGERGWELVAISNTPHSAEYFFKRPKS